MSSSKGLDGVKRIALAHGEKIGMALVVLVVGYLVYSSLGRETLPPDMKYDRLSSLTGQIRQKVDDSKWEVAVQNTPEEVKLYQPLSTGATLEVASQPYAWDRSGWDPAVVPPSSLRSDPKLLAPVEFEGHGITALFAFMSEEQRQALELQRQREERQREIEAREGRERMEAEAGRRTGRGREQEGEGGFFGAGGGTTIDPNDKNIRPVGISMPPAGVSLGGEELIEQHSVAVVLAKVPLSEQFQEYKNALADSRNFSPEIDFPEYLGYLVERAEVVPGAELAWQRVTVRNGAGGPPITSIDANRLGQAIADWVDFPDSPQSTPDQRHVHDFLTFPLPPLVGRDWGSMVVHSDVSLQSEVEMLEEEQGDELQPDPAGEDTGDFFGGPGLDGGGRPPGGRGVAPLRGPGRDDERGGTIGPRRRGTTAGGGTAFAPQQDPQTGEYVMDVPFIMFRFFDMTVEPGRRYKYRVRLVLRDVNGLRPSTELEPEVNARLAGKSSAQRQFVFADWSEPTPTISIPQAGTIKVAEAKTPTASALSELTVRLIVESYGVNPEKRSQVIQAFVETEARRGSVMNFFRQEVEKLIERGQYIQKVQDFNINTGVTVLDIDGGHRYTRDLQAPAQVLFIDAAGRIYLRDELDDERDVAIHRAVFAPPDKRGGGGGGAAPGFGGFGRE